MASLRCFVILTMFSVCVLTTARTTVRPTKVVPIDNVTKPFNCSLEHRKHPTSDSMFQKKWNEEWANYTCPVAGLIWNQGTCRCEDGPDGSDPCAQYSPVPDFPKKYIRTVWQRNFTMSCGYNMVWSQEVCTCRFAAPEELSAAAAVTAPCEVMLQASFDKEFADEARGGYIGRYPSSSATIEKPSGTVGGGAVCIKKGYITVPAFAGNELSRTFQIQFRVNINPDETDAVNPYYVLVSNGCVLTDPSVTIGFRTKDRTYVVEITDTSGTVSLTCSDQGQPGGWRLISLEVTNKKVVLRVNGRNCINAESTELTDQPKPTRCPLSFGGDARAVTKTMNSCFDEIMVRRFCIEQ